MPNGFSFLSGFPTLVRKRRVLVPFQVMADDSGCGGQGPLVIAGLIGQAEAWGRFADQWVDCLHQSPRIEYFKMREAAGRPTGEFYGFTATQRDDKLKALVKIIDDFEFTALHLTLDLAAHAKAFDLPVAAPKVRGGKSVKKTQKLLAIATNPYFVTYHTFMSAACFHLWEEEGSRETFDFIVDEHPSLGAPTSAWYPAMLTLMEEPQRSIMPSKPIPRNDEEFMPLQAADMIAWLQRNANNDKGKDMEWLGDCFTKLKQSPWCMMLHDEYFAFLRARADKVRAERPLPLETLIQLAILEGAPIQKPGKNE